jgi:hypothetical protein
MMLSTRSVSFRTNGTNSSVGMNASVQPFVFSAAFHSGVAATSSTNSLCCCWSSSVKPGRGDEPAPVHEVRVEPGLLQGGRVDGGRALRGRDRERAHPARLDPLGDL